MAEDALASPPRAVVFGLEGTELSAVERAFFADVDPLGFILFARNVETPGQVAELVQDLRHTIGRDDAPVLVDQEGGRVQRLGPPHWRAAPAARDLVDAARETSPGSEAAAVRINSRLIAEDLRGLGISVDCAPVLDVPQPGAHDIIGNRAYGDEPQTVARCGRAACEGFLSGGVLPVIKHLPGHGRARVDSHEQLPIVDAGRDELEETDFASFRALADMPWAMTAHVVFSAIDGDLPATLSPTVIGGLIRGDFRFEGVIVSDDLGMKALAGDFGERAERAIAAGCDVALHCSGDLEEMRAVAAATPRLAGESLDRVKRAEERRMAAMEPAAEWDADVALKRLRELTGGRA